MFENFLGGKRNFYLVVVATVTGVLLVASWWVLWFVSQQTQVDQVEEETLILDESRSLIYVNYQPKPDQVISPASYLAMADYQQQNEETINVEVLTDLSPVEIVGYMVNHFSGGMGVNCTHCHSLQNFAAEEWDDPVGMQNKMTARAHLRMTADLNKEWLASLPDLTPDKQPSGVQISCATCHNGVAQPNPWENLGGTLPADFRLPLDEEFSLEEVGILNVNARRDISLDTVRYQQNVMYHMNSSMNVGCTHCHNSRYFPSLEVPAVYYANNMLQMTAFIQNEYSDWLNGSEPSCYMCHQEAIIPPGAVRSAELMPGSLSTTGEAMTAP